MPLSEAQEQRVLAMLDSMERRHQSHGRMIQTSHGIFEEITADELADQERLGGQINRNMQAITMGNGASLARKASIPQQTLEAVQKSFVNRAESYSGNNAGFVGYILEDGARFIIPQLTVLRNMTPRVAMPGIDKITYRTVLDYFGGTGPSIGAGVVDQGGIPQQLQYQFKDLNYTAKMIGTSDIVPFETQIYGKSFQGDVLATASAKLIPALMQIEEVWLINSSQNLWTPPAVQVAGASTGGSLAAGTYWFIVTAVNANGETLGTSIQSVVVGGTSSGSATLTIFTVPEAVSYNVYAAVGASQPVSSAMYRQSAATNFGGASALNQPTSGVKQGYFTATMTSLTTSGTAYSTITANTAIRYKSSNAANLNAPLTFDGMLGVMYVNAGGAPSTYGVGGETPIIRQPANVNGVIALSDTDNLLNDMFLNSHADPDYLFCATVDHKTLSNLVAGGTNLRVIANSTPDQSRTDMVAGYRATAYINQTTGKVIPLPYMTQGTLVFGTYELPFQVQDIADAPVHVGYNRDMWSQIYAPDQSHPTQTMVAAYLNECWVNQALGFWSILNGVAIG